MPGRGSPALLPSILVMALLVCFAAVSVVVAAAFGAEPLPLRDVLDAVLAPVTGALADPTVSVIVWDLRLPRAVLALVVGAGLALAGGLVQTLVQNPLADPYLLGVSSGASVGATAVIALGVGAWAGRWALSGGALVGALGAALLVFGIAQAQGGLTPLRLVLTGTVLSSAMSSLASFFVFRSTDHGAAESVLFWLLGSLGGATWQTLVPPLVAVVMLSAAALAMSGWLDALAHGPDVAASLGVPVRQVRIGVFALQAVLVGVLVAAAGGIGFVGLIVPHIARLLVGTRHRTMLPVAAAMGALFLVWVDVAARIAVRPAEIPLSVVTGLVGAPVFLVLLGRRTYRFGGVA